MTSSSLLLASATTKMTACVVAGKRNNGKARENWWDVKAIEKGGARKDWWCSQNLLVMDGKMRIATVSNNFRRESTTRYNVTLSWPSQQEAGRGPLKNILPPTAAFSLRVSSSFEKLAFWSTDDAILSRIFRRHVDQPNENEMKVKSQEI